MKKVLLITYTQDNQCIEMVSDALKKKGALPVRFNTDTYPGETALTIEYSNNKWRNLIDTPQGTFDLNEFESLWYRRIRIGSRLYNTMEEKFLQPSIDESRRTFFGMLSSLDIFQLDSFLTVRKSENKQLQLKVADELGLKIPSTLITNKSNYVKDFYPKAPSMITKMQAAFAIYEDGKENVVFTNQIGEEEMQDLEGIELCPMTFQQNIEKKLELRITVVGDKVFAASIDSQSRELAKLDWRKQGIEMIKEWEEYKLPEEIKIKLLKLMDHFGLNYGGIDVIVTPDDQYYFLEVNPVGEFFWLEEKPGFPISTAIAEVLLGEGKRRWKR